MNEAQARRALVHYSIQSYRSGWVANHDGNLSVRINDDRIVCTPTAFSKAVVTLEDLVVVDGNGKKIAGRQRPFSELVLHLEVYRKRPGIHAVFHAHPPYATAFGSSGADMGHPFLPEAVVSLGDTIPTVPLTSPGADGATALGAWVKRCDAVMIAGNGILTWGPDLETAFLRAELVEHVAKIAHHGAALGGCKSLPVEMVKALVEKRRKGGLAAPDEGAQDVGSVSTPAKSASGLVRQALPNVSADLVSRMVAEVEKELRTGN